MVPEPVLRYLYLFEFALEMQQLKKKHLILMMLAGVTAGWCLPQEETEEEKQGMTAAWFIRFGNLWNVFVRTNLTWGHQITIPARITNAVERNVMLPCVWKTNTGQQLIAGIVAMAWNSSSGKIEQIRGVFLLTKFITWWKWPICVMQSWRSKEKLFLLERVKLGIRFTYGDF